MKKDEILKFLEDTEAVLDAHKKTLSEWVSDLHGEVQDDAKRHRELSSDLTKIEENARAVAEAEKQIETVNLETVKKDISRLETLRDVELPERENVARHGLGLLMDQLYTDFREKSRIFESLELKVQSVFETLKFFQEFDLVAPVTTSSDDDDGKGQNETLQPVVKKFVRVPLSVIKKRKDPPVSYLDEEVEMVNKKQRLEVPSKKGGASPQSRSRASWTVEEQGRLYEAYKRYGRHWKQVESVVRTRTDKGCANHMTTQGFASFLHSKGENAEDFLERYKDGSTGNTTPPPHRQSPIPRSPGRARDGTTDNPVLIPVELAKYEGIISSLKKHFALPRAKARITSLPGRSGGFVGEMILSDVPGISFQDLVKKRQWLGDALKVQLPSDEKRTMFVTYMQGSGVEII